MHEVYRAAAHVLMKTAQARKGLLGRIGEYARVVRGVNVAESRTARDTFKADSLKRIDVLEGKIKGLTTDRLGVSPKPFWYQSPKGRKLIGTGERSYDPLFDAENSLKERAPQMTGDAKKSAEKDLHARQHGYSHEYTDPALRSAWRDNQAAWGAFNVYDSKMSGRSMAARHRLDARKRAAEHSLENNLPPMDDAIRSEAARTSKYRQATGAGLVGVGGLAALLQRARDKRSPPNPTHS